MSAHRLLLSVGPRQRERLSPRDFLWRPRGEPSSMQVSVGPRLEELGAAPPLHVDFMRLAALVFLVDRSVERDRGPGVRWERELELTVPVSDQWVLAIDSAEFAFAGGGGCGLRLGGSR